jgi:hypothetical protein
MLDERLGRHSVVVASLGLIPGLLVITWLADGVVANPGASHSRALIWALFAIPPLAAFVLGLRTATTRSERSYSLVPRW